MLRLRQEIRSDPCRIRAAICHAANFRWAGDHVDADGTEDEALRHSDEGIARSYDLEDRLDRLRAVCQHRDALRTADLIDFLHTSHISSGQNIRIHLAILPWRCRHRDRRAARHERRYRIHEYGRRIGRAAARYIDADTLDRKELFPELHAISEILRPGLSHLFLVECLDIRFRFFQDFQKFRRHLRESFLHLFFRHAEIGELHPVEFLRQLTDGRITAVSHLFQNSGHGLLQLFRQIHIAVRQCTYFSQSKTFFRYCDPFHDVIILLSLYRLAGSGLAHGACRPLITCESGSAGSIGSRGSTGLVRRIKIKSAAEV